MKRRLTRYWVLLCVLAFSLCWFSRISSNNLDRASAAATLSSVDWTHYHNYTEIVDMLFWLNETHPGIVDVFSIGKSYLGKDIYCVRLTNEANSQFKTKVLFVGYHHATERISAELPLYFVIETATNWGFNQTVNRLLDYSEIFVVVALNVDGFEGVEKNEWQRKNLQPYDEDYDGLIDEDPPDDVDNDGYIEDLVKWTGDGWEFVRWEGVDEDGDGRLNEDWIGGTDLNRNYGYQWNATLEFGGLNPEDGDYHGPAAFSEPETQAIRDLTLEYNFAYAMSFHSGAQWITRPWMYTLTPTSDDEVFKEVQGALYRIVGILPPTGTRSTVSGTWDDWMYGNSGTLPFTCEIYRNESALQYTYSGTGSYYWERGGFQFYNPKPSDIETVVGRWLPALTYLTNRAVDEWIASTIYYELMVEAVGSGTTNPSPSNYSYVNGTGVIVEGIPDSGWILDHWELDAVNVGSANPYIVPMGRNHILKAVFSPVAPPVGGYAIPILGQATATPPTPYLALTAFIALAFATTKRKTKKPQ